MGAGKPCKECPHTSKAARDIIAVSKPEIQAAIMQGTWFCCHVNMGTCYGAQLRSEQLRRTHRANQA